MRKTQYRTAVFANSEESTIIAQGDNGATSRDGILWLNTANDSYFDPDLVQAMQAAFQANGGVLTPAHLGSYDRDGHQLFFGDDGSDLWGPVIEAYLRQRGVAMTVSHADL